MLYAASTNGFYSAEIHGNNMPPDAVEITDEKYRSLLDGQSQGKVITAGPSGPVLIDPPAVNAVPQTVTRFQARAALSRAGLFVAVNDMMMALPVDNEQRLAWTDALSFERNSPTLASLAPMVGMTSADLDALFTAAAQIEA